MTRGRITGSIRRKLSRPKGFRIHDPAAQWDEMPVRNRSSAASDPVYVIYVLFVATSLRAFVPSREKRCVPRLLVALLPGFWRPTFGRPRFHHEYVERLLTLERTSVLRARAAIAVLA